MYLEFLQITGNHNLQIHFQVGVCLVVNFVILKQDGKCTKRPFLGYWPAIKWPYVIEVMVISPSDDPGTWKPEQVLEIQLIYIHNSEGPGPRFWSNCPIVGNRWVSTNGIISSRDKVKDKIVGEIFQPGNFSAQMRWGL